jgi:hypothetical protein
MTSPKIILSFFFLLVVFAAKAQITEDTTVHYQRDSVIEVEADCITSFFQRTEWVDPVKINLITRDGKTVSMARFLGKAEGSFAQFGLIDMDSDGKKELVISNYTGGAHCCDEFYFFIRVASNKYKFSAKLFAGNTCALENNDLLFDFYEQFGYFFTCYACEFEDSTDTGPDKLHHITLRYKKGKLVIVPPDAELKSLINDNLAKLGEQPYEKLVDEIAQDNGLRKEFAINLAVYYFSFGKNIAATQALFNKYYKYPDGKKVWASFVKNLNYVKRDNTF